MVYFWLCAKVICFINGSRKWNNKLLFAEKKSFIEGGGIPITVSWIAMTISTSEEVIKKNL
jgi:hypothetical protein